MREFLEKLQNRGILDVVKENLSPELEVSAVLNELQDHALLFENVQGSKIRVAGNLYCKRSNIALGISGGDASEKELGSLVRSAIENPSATRGMIEGYRRNWEYNEEADLSKLPILKHFSKEAGHYLTAGIVVAKFPGSENENLSFHRMLVLSKSKVVARVVPRHLNQIARESQGKKVPVSILIGPPPSVFMSASLQTSYGLSEYMIANRLSNERLNLISSEMSDVAVPEDTEIVLEGYLDYGNQVEEGPFVDLTGTYDEVRAQPVITLERMHYNKNSVYQAILASSLEHGFFMGFPQELKIQDALSKSVPRVRGINLTPSSKGYFHCIVSIEKSNDGDGKTAILNCLAASHSLKLVVAVDSDLDPFDLRQVEWALATRFQADRGIVVVNGARGSSLDPSSGKLAVTSKLGLDATLPVRAEKGKFERATINVSTRAQFIIDALRKAKVTNESSKSSNHDHKENSAS